MGYFLFFENMLESVLRARDRLLVPGGHIFPNHANLYVAAYSFDDSKIDFWKNCYGFDLSELYESPEDKHMLRLEANPSYILSPEVNIKAIDICNSSPSLSFILTGILLQYTRASPGTQFLPQEHCEKYHLTF